MKSLGANIIYANETTATLNEKRTYAKIIQLYNQNLTMNQTINVSGLKPEQIEQIQSIIQAF